MRKWRLKNLSIAIAGVLLGHQLEIQVIPFRWARPALRTKKDMPVFHQPTWWHFQLFLGPLHIWTMDGLSKTIGADITIGQNPFHGGAISPRKAK